MRPVSDISALLAEAAADVPDRVALVEVDGRRLAWGALEDSVAGFASGLGDLGVVAGTRVLLAMSNRIEFVVAYLGVLRAQAVAVPVNPATPVVDLARMVADSGCRAAVVDGAAAEAVRDAAALVAAARAGEQTEIDAEVAARAHEVQLVVLDGDERAESAETSYDVVVGAEAREIPPLQDPEKLAALLYTPGTTGRPRAAMLTHRALLANLEQVARVQPPMMHGDDVVLCMLPLFHVYGLNAVLGSALRHRARLVLQDGFDAQSTLDLIEDEAVSVVPVAPPVFRHWLPIEGLAERLGPVRLVLSGSAPLPRETIEEFTGLTGIPVHQGYGLTEAAPVVTSTLRSTAESPGSLGAPLEGVEVRVLDQDGRVVRGDDPGEIEIRGDNLFSGYWPLGSERPRADGWWPTGDVGYLDEHGDLTLVDRLGEVVVISGFAVYPREVEAVLKTVPGVAEAAVIGVADDENGQSVVAYVVPEPGAADGLAEALQRASAGGLARFKQPSRIEVVDELPRTVTGRVQKGRLRGIERRRALGLVE